MKFNNNELIEQIKAIGEGLIDNASSIVTDLENKSNIYILVFLLLPIQSHLLMFKQNFSQMRF